MQSVLESRRLTYREGKRSLLEQLRHAKEQFQANAGNKAWWYFEFTNQIVPLLPYGPKSPSDSAIHVMDEPWNNLVILDACRADAFRRILSLHRDDFKPFDYDYSTVESLGTYTPEFLTLNFAGGSHPDTVYVSANPYVSSLIPKGTFKEVVEVWRSKWDPKHQTVLPRDVARAAINVRHENPDSRLIVHFMQPHTPFIGKDSLPGEAFWDIALNAGLDKAKAAYLGNLEAVFAVLPTLLTYFGGRTVISADHGEAWGEPAPPLGIPIFGHPKRVHIPSLTEVPWMESRKAEASGSEGARYLRAKLALTRSKIEN